MNEWPAPDPAGVQPRPHEYSLELVTWLLDVQATNLIDHQKTILVLAQAISAIGKRLGDVEEALNAIFGAARKAPTPDSNSTPAPHPGQYL